MLETAFVKDQVTSNRSIPLTADLVVDSVLVHPAHATVTRRGHLQLLSGEHVIHLGWLPNAALPDSVRINLLSHDVTLQDVAIQADSMTSEADGADARAELAKLYTQRDFLKHLAEAAPSAFAQGLGNGQIALQAVHDYMEFISQQLQLKQSAIAAAEQQQNDLPSDHQSPSLVKANVHASAATTVEIELTYTVKQAGWVPTYIAQLDSKAAQLQLLCLADIQQETGEDWQNVRLTLSSGQSHGLTAASESAPSSNRYSSHPPHKQSQILEDAYRMLGAVPGSELPSMNHRETQPVPETRATMQLSVPERHSLRTGDGRSFQVTRYEHAVELKAVAYPRKFTHPQLQAELRLDLGGGVLLPGPVKLFCDRSYQGTAEIPQLVHLEPLQLNFGIVSQISIQHVPTGSQGNQTWGQRIILHNHDHSEQRCIVLDKPVTADKIQAQIIQATPEPTATSEEESLWELVLPPGKSMTIEYHYHLSKTSSLSRLS